MSSRAFHSIDPQAENDVLLAFVHNGSVRTEFMDSVIAALTEDARRASPTPSGIHLTAIRNGHRPRRRLTEYHGASGPYIHDNRSRVARYFLEETDKQWLWFLDNDMSFPVDSLYRMLDAAERYGTRILGAAYWNQYSASEPYLSWLLFTPEGIKAVRSLPQGQEPVQVTAVGMGCTLIHRSVLLDVADSYPNDPWDTFAADMLVRFVDGGYVVGRTPEDFDAKMMSERPIADISRMGEDVSMCLRAAKAGHLSYGLPTVVAEHHKAHLMAHGSNAGSTSFEAVKSGALADA